VGKKNFNVIWWAEYTPALEHDCYLHEKRLHIFPRSPLKAKPVSHKTYCVLNKNLGTTVLLKKRAPKLLSRVSERQHHNCLATTKSKMRLKTDSGSSSTFLLILRLSLVNSLFFIKALITLLRD
jgi:hypothetical protein